MSLFENRKRSGMVLTGVILSSGAVSAVNQCVVEAVPQGTNPKVTNLPSTVNTKKLGNQGSNFYGTAGYVFLLGCAVSVLVYLLYKFIVYLSESVGDKELIYLEKEKVIGRFTENQDQYGDEIKGLLNQFVEGNSNCECLVYNRKTREFYAIDKKGRCPEDEKTKVRRIVKCKGEKILNFRKAFFEAVDRELQKEDELAYSEPNLKKCFTSKTKVEYSDEVKSLFAFVYSLNSWINGISLTVSKDNLRPIMLNDGAFGNLKIKNNNLKIKNNNLKIKNNNLEDEIDKIIVVKFLKADLEINSEQLNGRMIFEGEEKCFPAYTKFLTNNLRDVVLFYNFILHEAYIQGKMNKNIQFSIEGKDHKIVYVEEGMGEKIKKIKLNDLMKYKRDSETFRNFVFRYESDQNLN